MDEKLHVLFITHYAELYGANHSLLQLMKELKSDYNVLPRVVLPFKGRLTEALEKEEIPYIVSRFYIWEYQEGNRLKSTLLYFTNLWHYIRLYMRVRSLKFDLIHSNSSVIDAGVFLKCLLRKPHIWHLREFGKEDYDISYIWGRKFSSWVYRKGGDELIAISRAIYDYYHSLIKTDKIALIYNGIKTPEVFIPRKKQACVEFCCVGALTPLKGQLQIIEAVSFLTEKGIKNFRVNFIGRFHSEEYRQAMLSYISGHQIGEYVKFWGYQSDVPSLLSQMDVGITPSVKEAFGRVTVEYMMHGMPVLATDSGANPEIVKDKETGFLFPEGNALSLAKSMEHFINFPQDISLFGEKGKERAYAYFTSGRNTEKVYSLYQKVLAHA